MICCLLTFAFQCRADLFEDSEIQVLLKFKPWWTKLSPSTAQEGEAGESKMFIIFNHVIHRTLNRNFLTRTQTRLCYRNNTVIFLFFQNETNYGSIVSISDIILYSAHVLYFSTFSLK